MIGDDPGQSTVEENDDGMDLDDLLLALTVPRRTPSTTALNLNAPNKKQARKFGTSSKAPSYVHARATFLIFLTMLLFALMAFPDDNCLEETREHSILLFPPSNGSSTSSIYDLMTSMPCGYMCETRHGVGDCTSCGPEDIEGTTQTSTSLAGNKGRVRFFLQSRNYGLLPWGRQS